MPLLGRDDLAAALRAELTRAEARAGCVVVVRGEADAGKTSLVRFGTREELAVRWQRDDGHPGSEQRRVDDD